MGKARNKIYGKVVGKDASDRPGWKGPSYTKKKPTPPPKPVPSSNTEDQQENPDLVPTIPLELQQLLLNIFKDTFKDVLESNERQTLLQDVKNALYERDFARAFGKREFLETYSVRWSPSRALCYLVVLDGLVGDLRELFPGCGVLGEEREEVVGGSKTGKERGMGMGTLKTVCFGGGAAEVVAFGGFLKRVLDCGAGDGDSEREEEDVTGKETVLEKEVESLSIQDSVEDVDSQTQEGDLESAHTPATVENPASSSKEEENPKPTTTTTTSPAQTSTPFSSTPLPILDLILIDNAQWGEVITSLTTSLVSPPPISKYANALAKASNHSLLHPSQISTTFHALDILTLSPSQLSSLLGPSPLLLTLLFTLNELYTTSISLTTKFLLNLTSTAPKGTLLLVVDSPGSYSETKVGKGEESKKYPMHWLMDHTLLGTAKVEDQAVWEKLVGEEARWWRVAEELRYPISLENMRFQIHLYRRL